MHEEENSYYSEITGANILSPSPDFNLCVSDCLNLILIWCLCFAFWLFTLWFVTWCFSVPFILPVWTRILAMTWAAISPILKHSGVASAYTVKKNDVVSFILEPGSVQQKAHNVRGTRKPKPEVGRTADSGCLIHSHCVTCVFGEEWRTKITHTV